MVADEPEKAVGKAETQRPAAPGRGAVALRSPAVPSYGPRRHASRLPAPIRFPLVMVLSLAIVSVGYTFLGELAPISKTLDTWAEVGVLVGWRM